MIAYYDFRWWDLHNLVTGEKATNNWATLTADHLGYSNAYNFSSGHITLQQPVFSWTWEITIVAIFKKENEESDQTHIIWNNDSQANRWNMYVYDWNWNSLSFWNDNWDNDVWIKLSTDIIDGKWHMWTFRSNNDWSELILDNFSETWSSSNSINFSSDTNYIWYFPTIDMDFWWDISVVLVYNRYLYDNEIKVLYNLLMK